MNITPANQEPVFDHEKGKYRGTCIHCGKTFWGNIRKRVCDDICRTRKNNILQKEKNLKAKSKKEEIETIKEKNRKILSAWFLKAPEELRTKQTLTGLGFDFGDSFWESISLDSPIVLFYRDYHLIDAGAGKYRVDRNPFTKRDAVAPQPVDKPKEERLFTSPTDFLRLDEWI